MWKLSNISIKGILTGIVFDVLASIILSIAVMAVFAAVAGISPENQSELESAIDASFSVHLAFLIGGLLIALAMGFVAERFASEPALINAAICGGVLLLFHIAMSYIEPEAAPIWSQIVIILCVVPLSIAGGWLNGAIRNT